MSDKERVLATLSLICETCSASKTALDQPDAQASQPELAPSLAVLRKDFLSILTLLYTLTTKVSLTLRPGEAAFSASMAPLQDLAKYISSLTTCATLFDAHGRTLSTDAKSGAKGVLESLQAFAAAFTRIVEQGEATTENYLVRTGAVHDAIDQLRRGLPEDNVVAVQKRWSTDREMLEDSVGEVAEMVERGGAPAEDDDFDDEFGDEWDELGLGASKKMTAQELDRTKKIQPLLRMVVLLHKRVLLDIIKVAKGANNAPATTSALDALPQQSHNLLLAVEESVAVLYSPQDLSTLRAATATLTAAVTSLKGVLHDQNLLTRAEAAVDVLAKDMAAVSINSLSALKKGHDRRKWFDTCFGQIEKLSQTIVASLEAEAQSSSG